MTAIERIGEFEMKKFFEKAISVIMALCLMLGLLPVLSMEASAETYDLYNVDSSL